MSYLPFALLSYLFNATSTTIDKFLLTKSVANPLTYIFYISLLSLLALLLLPFTHIPSSQVFILGSASSVFWTIGAYFMFRALQIGQVARVVPIIGTLTPIFLLAEAVATQTITQQQIIAVSILILGLIILTVLDWKGNFKKAEIIQEFLSSLFFAVSYILLREAYLHDQFLTVFIWSKFIVVLFVLAVWLIPRTKKIVSTNGSQASFKLNSGSGLLFLTGQGAGGTSQILLTYAISLASPALVNSLQGSQYAFLFLFSLVLSRRYPEVFREKWTATVLITKILGIAVVGAGLYLLAT